MPQLLLLVGPKGAGKTRIATLLAQVFGAYAVPVERMWRERLARTQGDGRPSAREVFDEVADHALAALAANELVVLDTTGASEHTTAFVERLSRSGVLRIVRVAAPTGVCTERALARDATDQISVTPEQLAAVNLVAAGVSLDVDRTFDNAGLWRELDVRGWWADFLRERDPSLRATRGEPETERLVLRDWSDADLAPFAALNADPVVMEHFPAPLTRDESDALAGRIRADLARRGVGLFAVEAKAGTIAESPCFVGFCGLSVPSFEAPFLPAVEIGWRLARTAWGRGLATEAARACLALGFSLGLPEIVSFTSPRNTRSISVMERLGMTRDRAADFDHPRVPRGHPLRPHVLYRLAAPREAAKDGARA
jgi:RimJ/RimL family protein N-acetyltransferase/predicted kinase